MSARGPATSTSPIAAARTDSSSTYQIESIGHVHIYCTVCMHHAVNRVPLPRSSSARSAAALALRFFARGHARAPLLGPPSLRCRARPLLCHPHPRAPLRLPPASFTEEEEVRREEKRRKKMCSCHVGSMYFFLKKIC